MIDKLSSRPTRLYSIADASGSLDKFKKLCEKKCARSDYPNSSSVEKSIPVYDLSSVSPSDSTKIATLQDEWYNILHTGPGVFVLQNFYPDTSSILSINQVFDTIIADEAVQSGGKKGDHFAASGKNARIWNSFQKHALESPDTFSKYYSNPWLSHVSTCWLGPGYRITAQVNIVRPGGAPQVVHRDYHLGFQGAEQCALVPRGMQIASQFLTLQGAIAHSDMPLESGPTRLLPFSQQLEEGYMAYRLAEYQEYFDSHWVSLALKQGDAIFFNPALFHAAGENTTSHIHRSANLLQISSAFGKPMESVNTLAVIEACWQQLSEKYAAEGLSLETKALIAAVAEGYPFPMNLDRRPPSSGDMAPECEADFVTRVLIEGWAKDEVMEMLRALRHNSSA